MKRKWIILLLVFCNCSNWEIKNENDTAPLQLSSKDSCLYYEKCLKECLSKPATGYGFYGYNRKDVRYGIPIPPDTRNGKLNYLIYCENQCKENYYCQ